MKVKTTLMIGGVLLALVVSLAVAQKNAVTTSAERFDMAVREDFFSGMAGDSAAFARAMNGAKIASQRILATLKPWSGTGPDCIFRLARHSNPATAGRECVWLTRYAKAANALLENKPAPDQASVTCKGCHTPGAQ